jgi:hypothetical protein
VTNDSNLPAASTLPDDDLSRDLTLSGPTQVQKTLLEAVTLA